MGQKNLETYEMTDTYYDYIFAHFMDFYGFAYPNIVKWEPIGRFDIAIYCADGSKAFYDHSSGVVYNVQKRQGDDEFVDMDIYTKRFVWKLNAALNASGMTRDEISQRTGISKSSLSGYLTGRNLPNIHNLYKIAKVLKCSPDELLNVGDWDL